MRNYINKIIKKEKKVKKIETKFILILFLLFSLLNVIVNPISYAEEEIEQQQEELLKRIERMNVVHCKKASFIHTLFSLCVCVFL